MKELIINNPIEKVIREGTGYKDLEKYELSIEEMIGGFALDHAKYKKIIEEIITGWSQASNSDWFLYIEVLRCLGLCKVTSGSENFVFTIKRKDLKYLPTTESIRRSRQELNHKNLCMPTNKIVQERRAKREIAIRRYFQENK